MAGSAARSVTAASHVESVAKDTKPKMPKMMFQTRVGKIGKLMSQIIMNKMKYTVPSCFIG